MTRLKKTLTIFALARIPIVAIAGHHGTKKDIVDTEISSGSFKTPVTAVKGDAPFTVFSPTDKAFAKLPPGTIATLLKPENKSKLVAILTHHVLSGAVPAKAVVGKTLSRKTVNGSSLKIDGTNGVVVSDAKVILADVMAKNGVIHVINRILLP
ncbi:MAG: fasciclin domain-containing protein [Pseudomonadota bacterium]|nr:fasciclin domain-containing protein [Pseudomonadota bacterium]